MEWVECRVGCGAVRGRHDMMVERVERECVGQTVEERVGREFVGLKDGVK